MPTYRSETQWESEEDIARIVALIRAGKGHGLILDEMGLDDRFTRFEALNDDRFRYVSAMDNRRDVMGFDNLVSLFRDGELYEFNGAGHKRHDAYEDEQFAIEEQKRREGEPLFVMLTNICADRGVVLDDGARETLMDLGRQTAMDAIVRLAREPDYLLEDELAHTPSPGLA